MKFDLVKDELSTLLEELSEQFHTMNAHEQTIPQIELDIFRRNIQKLYENTLFLNKLNKSKDPMLTVPETIILEEEVKETVIIEKMEDIQQPKTPTAIEEPEEIKPDPTIFQQEHLPEEAKQEDLIDPIIDESIHLNHEENLTQEKIIPQITEKQITETNLFSQVKSEDEVDDINKKLADSNSTSSIVEKLQNNRIESLKSVIGINDKFYFINELFGGDTQKYEDIIYTLNNFKKLDDAMQYFSTLKYRFTWDEESEPYAKLTHMLERKFDFIDA